MTIHRSEPTCPYCGKKIAKAVYNQNADNIGDNFIRWEYISHKCRKTPMQKSTGFSIALHNWLKNKLNGK